AGAAADLQRQHAKQREGAALPYRPPPCCRLNAARNQRRDAHHQRGLCREQPEDRPTNRPQRLATHNFFLRSAISFSSWLNSSRLTSRVVKRWLTTSSRLPSKSRSTRWSAMPRETSCAATFAE